MYISHPDQIAAKLLKCNGWSAKLWHFEPTHMKAVIRLVPPDGSEGLHVICGGASRLSGPLYWQNAKLTAHFNQSGEQVKLSDSNGFELVCAQIFLKENVGLFDPPFGIASWDKDDEK